MNDISDISGRTEFIETTLKNCKTLLRLLYDVEDAKYVQEDIEYSLHDIEYSLHDIEKIYQRYDTLANRVITQQSVYRDMCRERDELNDKIQELERKLGVINDSKKTGIRNIALRVFKNRQPKEPQEPQKVSVSQRAKEILETWMQDEKYM